MVSITGLGHIVKVHSNKMHPQLCKLCLTRDPNLTIKGLGRAWCILGLGATCQGLESIGDYEEPGLGVVLFTWIGASAISHFVLKTSAALLGKTFSA